jgi:invasion protein IalB
MDIRPSTLLAAPLLAATVIAAAFPVMAADGTKSLGTFGGWRSFAYAEGGGKVCYTLAEAAKVQGGEKGNNATFLIVTHRPATKHNNEVSVSGAYGFKKDTGVEMQVGATKYSLFTKGDRAWAKDAATDKAAVAALEKGREATLHATPAKGAALTAGIPLTGFGAALTAIDKACGVKR